MNPNKIKNILLEMKTVSESLLSSFSNERNLMRAWDTEKLNALRYEKEYFAGSLQTLNSELEKEILKIASYLACASTEVLNKSEFRELRPIRDAVKKMSRDIQLESEVNKRLAESALRFLKKLQGESDNTQLEAYGRSRLGYSGSRMYSVA